MLPRLFARQDARDFEDSIQVGSVPGLSMLRDFPRGKCERAGMGIIYPSLYLVLFLKASSLPRYYRILSGGMVTQMLGFCSLGTQFGELSFRRVSLSDARCQMTIE